MEKRTRFIRVGVGGGGEVPTAATGLWCWWDVAKFERSMPIYIHATEDDRSYIYAGLEWGCSAEKK
jgi:hypothetical protein